VSDWWQATDRLGAGSAVMVALRQADVDDLNERARALLGAAGRLSGAPLQVAGSDLQFQVGDRVLCLRNDRRIGVDNGTLAHVTGIGEGSLQVRTDDGRDLTLPGTYLASGHVTHGYAITGHKAQGQTVDHTFVLGSDELYREWGYVAMSRGRESNRLYVHPAIPDPHGIAHGHPEPVDPDAQTLAGPRRSHAQQAAVTHLDRDDVPALAARWRDLQRELATAAQARSLRAERSRLAEDVGHLDTSIERTVRELAAAAGGIGRLSRSRRQGVAYLDQQLTRLGVRRAEAMDQLTALEARLVALPSPDQEGPLHDEAKRARNRLWAAIQHRIPGIEAHPPAYVLATIGERPTGIADRGVWRDAVTQLEAYRLCWDVRHPTRALGDELASRDPAERSHRTETVQVLARAVDRLRHDELERDEQRGLSRSLGRSISR